MPIINALKPATYPADFLAWAGSLHRFKRLTARSAGGKVLRFDTLQPRPHHNNDVTVYSEVLLDSARLTEDGWRSYVATQIKGMRLHCRRILTPATHKKARQG